jgi:broad specificity phosphatase PhoE
MKRVCPIVLLYLCAGAIFAQTTVFVVRHADRGPEEPDPPITQEGRRQAASLARLLADAKVTHIYTSEAIRTQQTAAPTARHFGIRPVVVDSKDIDGLVRQVRASARPEESILVVGHRGTVPRIVKALSGKDVSPLAFDEFDRLEVVTMFPDGRANVVMLRYSH